MDDTDMAALDRLPAGYSEVMFNARRWGVTVTTGAEGSSRSLYAEELGGTGTVSANVYVVSSGIVLRPCEMPADTVLAFLRGIRPAPPRHDGPGYARLVRLDLPSWVPDRVTNLATELAVRARFALRHSRFRR